MRRLWFQRNRASELIPRNPYFFLGGRRMRIDTAYVLPSDIQESSRLDFQHIMLRNLLKRNYLAPIHTPLSILDVACGTGRWGAEMAREFPKANVIGIDINPPSLSSPGVMLDQSQVADNYTFEKWDITHFPLPFSDDTFDFIHMRFVIMALPADKWVPLIQELHRITRPGGWVEVVESIIAAFTPEGEPFVEWVKTVMKNRNIDYKAGTQIGNYMKQAGFRNRHFMPIHIPVGKWGGHIGTSAAVDIISGSKALKVPVVQIAKLASEEEFEQRIARMNHAYNNTSGATWEIYFAYGQK
jgi:ubiquinone/menaquinone biosynthesis C-methylase UbiE